jgi:cobalamin biosynthesis protein CobD/CbiB
MIKLRKKLAALAVCYFSVPALFAADVMPDNMKTLAENVKDTITGPFFKMFFGILMCASAVAYAYNKDNEKIKGKMLAILIATGILFGAAWVMDAIWGK